MDCTQFLWCENSLKVLISNSFTSLLCMFSHIDLIINMKYDIKS